MCQRESAFLKTCFRLFLSTDLHNTRYGLIRSFGQNEQEWYGNSRLSPYTPIKSFSLGTLRKKVILKTKSNGIPRQKSVFKWHWGCGSNQQKPGNPKLTFIQTVVPFFPTLCVLVSSLPFEFPGSGNQAALNYSTLGLLFNGNVPWGYMLTCKCSSVLL